jgi:AraC-like DNA-binding protein
LEVAGFCAELTSKECGCIAQLTNTDASEIELARSRHLASITKDTEQRLECYVGALAELLTGALQDVPLLGGSNERAAQQGYVITAIDYIEKHFFEELTPCDVATHCNVSLSYLQHLFVSYTGEGIATAIRQRRMEHACELLSATDRSVRSIAIACGYYDTDYFSVVFKRVYGITPLKFRKRGFIK